MPTRTVPQGARPALVQAAVGPSQPRFRLGATDRLILLYNGAAAALVLASAGRVRAWPWLLLLHAITAALVLLLARGRTGRHAGRWAWPHLMYPFAIIVLLYQEAGLLRHLVVPADLDPKAVALELRLFGRPWYSTLAAGMGLPSLEAWHALYWSYYALLLLPAAAARARHLPQVDRYVFVVVFTFVVHFVVYMLVPVSGPAELRSGLMPPGVLFIPVMDAIHRAGTRGGLAWPSLHVAAALVAAVFGSRWFPRLRLLLVGWFGLVAASTVVCCYHYVVDVAAGLVSGTLCLAAGTRLWLRRGPRTSCTDGGPD